MRWANRIVVSVFARDDAELVKAGLLDLVGLDVPLKKSKMQGFNMRFIDKFEVVLLKSSHISHFLRHFLGLFSAEQRDVLASQAESRLDERFNFFIRVDKASWIEKRRFFLTDSGECFHVRISLAVFPSKRAVALQNVASLLESFL